MMIGDSKPDFINKGTRGTRMVRHEPCQIFCLPSFPQPPLLCGYLCPLSTKFSKFADEWWNAM